MESVRSGKEQEALQAEQPILLSALTPAGDLPNSDQLLQPMVSLQDVFDEATQEIQRLKNHFVRDTLVSKGNALIRILHSNTISPTNQ